AGGRRLPARALASRRRGGGLPPVGAFPLVSPRPRGIPRIRAHPLRPSRRRPVRWREGGLAFARDVPPRHHAGRCPALPGRAPQAEVLRPPDGGATRSRADPLKPRRPPDTWLGPPLLPPA